MAWSPDGRYLASSDGVWTQVWDAVNGVQVFTYSGHPGRVRAVAWSPDGWRIASGCCSSFKSGPTVQVWDAADGGNVYTYRGHTDQVYAVAWSPDGTRIASGGRNRKLGVDTSVQVWVAE